MSMAQSESIFAQSLEPTTDLSPQHGNTPPIKVSIISSAGSVLSTCEHESVVDVMLTPL